MNTVGKAIIIDKIRLGGGHPFVLIAGPCVIESKQKAEHIATVLKDITTKLDIPFIFKASYDKANRSSVDSFRGPGLKKGLTILQDIKSKLNIPVLSDVHGVEEIDDAAAVLDVLQIPAFLCRQTDLLLAAGKSKKAINIKKGQFMAPADMKQAVRKVEYAGNEKILLTERGVSFGYNNLVTDFRSLSIMQHLGCPVIFDASHSVQQPGGLGHASGGNSEFIPLLARCGVAAGCDGVFIEVHSDPKHALSDGPNMLALDEIEHLLVQLKSIDDIVKNRTEKNRST